MNRNYLKLRQTYRDNGGNHLRQFGYMAIPLSKLPCNDCCCERNPYDINLKFKFFFDNDITLVVYGVDDAFKESFTYEVLYQNEVIIKCKYKTINDLKNLIKFGFNSITKFTSLTKNLYAGLVPNKL